jgi:hypothetical protein
MRLREIRPGKIGINGFHHHHHHHQAISRTDEQSTIRMNGNDMESYDGFNVFDTLGSTDFKQLKHLLDKSLNSVQHSAASGCSTRYQRLGYNSQAYILEEDGFQSRCMLATIATVERVLVVVFHVGNGG